LHIGTEVYGERIIFIRHALRASFSIEEIFNLTKIDRWFLVQIKEIVDLRKNWRGRRIDFGVASVLASCR
jgi:carbamoyl-phosphate synthase large subunit